jgi:hypothetical protein
MEMGTESKKGKSKRSRLVIHEPERQEMCDPASSSYPRSHRLLRSLSTEQQPYPRTESCLVTLSKPLYSRFFDIFYSSQQPMFPRTMTNPRYHNYGLPLSLVL